MRFILLSIILILASYLQAQLATSEINLNKLNTSLLEELIIKKLNEDRLEQNGFIVKRDAILSLAAQDQAKYMGTQKKISTSQTTKGKESTFKRVVFYKGTHEGIVENCTSVYIKKNAPSKSTKNTKIITTYTDAANAIYDNWKRNKGHTKNMINPSADVYGIGFYLSEDSVLYTSQIFAYKPYQPIKSKEIKDSDYGILPKNPAICKCFESYEASVATSSILLQTIDETIYIKSENLKELKNFFAGPKDAIYIDIILRNQFGCDNNILLHGSPVYDGTMLKPVLFSELFKNNQAKDNLNMYAPLCKIPDYFKNRNYACNIGFVKNGYSCDYKTTYNPPIHNFSLIGLNPKWIYMKNKPFNTDSISGKMDLKIPFKRNETTIDVEYKNVIERKLKNINSAIKEIKIKTYSSVEGSEEINFKLQEKRAQEINKLLSKIINKDVKLTYEIKENWDDFYLNIHNTPFAYLEKLNKSEIKKRLNKKSLLDSVAPILKKSRISSLEIKLETDYNFNTEPDLMLACYQMAVSNEDSIRTATIQNRLLDYTFEKKLDEKELLSISLPYTKKFLPIWSNYLALHLSNPDKNNFFSVRDTGLKAIKIDSTFMPLQINFCLLTLNQLNYYDDTIIPIANLEKKMNETYKLLKDKNDTTLVNHMWLNYSILSLYNHNERYEYDKLNKHLLNVKKYYPVAEITEQEAMYLGLLFNYYSRYNWSLNMIYPYLKKGSKNEDLLFVYLQTYGYNGNLPSEEWKNYLKLAKELNSSRFNYWIDKVDFQNLRAKEIKKLFCE